MSKFYLSRYYPASFVYWGFSYKKLHGHHRLSIKPRSSICRSYIVSSLPQARGPTQLDKSQGLNFVTKDIDTLVLDCDGVLWRGDKLLYRTTEALNTLRALGKRLLFLTNNASKSRLQYKSKFESLGIQVHASEIVPASYCAAAYLQSLCFPLHKTVLLIGNTGVEQELNQAGISYVGGESDFFPDMCSPSDIEAIKVDPSIGAVVVGFDPRFSYSKLAYATACLRELPGCRFVLTNGDHGDKVGGGRIMPGTGAISAAIETSSGRKPVTVGKGGPWLLPWLCEHYGLEDTRRVCIVGDRLDTDIALGKQGGLRTVLPLTGVTSLEDLQAAGEEQLPDFYVPNLATLAGL